MIMPGRNRLEGGSYSDCPGAFLLFFISWCRLSILSRARMPFAMKLRHALSRKAALLFAGNTVGILHEC